MAESKWDRERILDLIERDRQDIQQLRNDLGEAVLQINKDMSDLKVNIATLETTLTLKASAWGLVAGILPIIGTLLIAMLMKKL